MEPCRTPLVTGASLMPPQSLSPFVPKPCAHCHPAHGRFIQLGLDKHFVLKDPGRDSLESLAGMQILHLHPVGSQGVTMSQEESETRWLRPGPASSSRALQQLPGKSFPGFFQEVRLKGLYWSRAAPVLVSYWPVLVFNVPLLVPVCSVPVCTGPILLPYGSSLLSS